MSQLIRITTKNEIEIIHLDQTYSLQLLQELVGGYIEFISLPKYGLEMIVNEEGKLNGLPINLAGTMYWNRQYENLDYVVGDIVLLNATTDANGDPAGLTENQVARIVQDVDRWLEDAEEANFDRREARQEYLMEKGRI